MSDKNDDMGRRDDGLSPRHMGMPGSNYQGFYKVRITDRWGKEHVFLSVKVRHPIELYDADGNKVAEFDDYKRFEVCGVNAEFWRRKQDRWG